jgi:nucleoside-diphosphate-sugar epimerase
MSIDRNDRILITGGTGFIGGRLTQMLANRGYRVRVATSHFRNCTRVAGSPVELVKADLSDHASLVRAVADCSVVFHFGYRFGGCDERRINFEGTVALAEAFQRNGGSRFVHISSITAYGEPRDGEITEESPQQPSREAYGNIKREIEGALLRLHNTCGLPVTILQPTIVYGPNGYFFTIRPLEELRSRRVALPAGGLCNAVYVDDVVSAAIFAAEREAAIGEKFIISGSSPTTWRKFYGAYEKMLNKDAVIELDDEQMRLEEEHRLQKSRRGLELLPGGSLLASGRRVLPNSLKAVIKRRLGTLWNTPLERVENSQSLYLYEGFLRALYAAKSHARIDKARKQLGYDPAYNLTEGMARTAEWARWANLLSA